MILKTKYLLNDTFGQRKMKVKCRTCTQKGQISLSENSKGKLKKVGGGGVVVRGSLLQLNIISFMFTCPKNIFMEWEKRVYFL